METTYSAEIQAIIDEEEEIRKDIREQYKYTDVDSGNFTATDIRVLYFMVCLEPKSTCYGRGLGAFVYKDDSVYRFHYNIHTTYSKGPHLSNKMTSISRIIMRERHGIAATERLETSFGRKAFWMHTPDDCLNPEEKALRELMKSLAVYCRKEDLCKKLRKTDKAHEKWEKETR